jgi:hypothetical protein
VCIQERDIPAVVQVAVRDDDGVKLGKVDVRKVRIHVFALLRELDTAVDKAVEVVFTYVYAGAPYFHRSP